MDLGRSGSDRLCRAERRRSETIKNRCLLLLLLRRELYANADPKGITVSEQETAAINITYADFRGEWNCTIRPNNRKDITVDP